jgi:hypothetical protein
VVKFFPLMDPVSVRANPTGPDLQFWREQPICQVMDQEIIRPETPRAPTSHSMGIFNSFLSAAGVVLLSVTKLGAAFAAVIWALSQLLGLPDVVMYGLMVLGLIPVIWSTIWVAGRAWHVEQLLESGKDVDRPVFSAFHYWKKS